MEPINDDLLIKYLLRETSEEEDEAVNFWLETDTVNRKRYEDLQWIWDSSKKITRPDNQDTEGAWQRFKIRRGSSQFSADKLPRLMSSPWLRVAASCTLLIGFLGIISLSLPHGGRAYFMPVSLEAGDTVESEKLLDGSMITLNKKTSLTYSQPLFSNTRHVELKSGEAYFDVASDKNRPFIINTRNIAIRVLGTSFNVKSTSIAQEVILEKGSVEIALGSEKITLMPGEIGNVDPQTNKLKKSKAAHALYRYYVNNLFKAENLPLEELVQALREAYKVSILIPNKTLQSQPITTTLVYGSLEQNLEVISETLDVQISKRGEQFIIE